MILMNRQELIFIFIRSLFTRPPHPHPPVPWGQSSLMESYEAVDSGYSQL